MLPKSKRLNLKKDFKWVAAGRKIETQFVKLFIKKGDNPTPRIGIATSSKVFKKATDRNRVKRLISNTFENLYSRLPVGINIVALPKSGVIEVKSTEVSEEVETILKNEKIIN